MALITKWFLPLSIFFSTLSLHAQEMEGRQKCAHAKSKIVSRTTVADVGEDNYDVKYVKLDVALDNTSTHISGNVTTVAEATVTSLSAYVFELDAAHTIDSVLINGVPAAIASAGAIRTVTLSPAIPAGATFTAQVFYGGTPASGSLFGTLGINNIASPSWGNRATFTLSESYHAFEWWPCKQSLRDKIDSADIWITVPDSLKAGSNGKLENITTIDAGHVRYEWKERHAIDYYLVSLSVANYIDHSYYMHFTGSSDSMLVQNYIYNNPATLPTFASVIDSTGYIIDYFSQLYGRYPFWEEKYGHCMAPLGGGMEHQTMTTLGSFFDPSIVAHELGHQWFGDNATCGSWADIFMNEGFASYDEDLYYEHFRNRATMQADMVNRQTNVKSEPGGAIYVDDTTSEGRIFDSRLSYDKGACLLHMLRFVIDNDTTFLNVWRTYQQQRADSTGTIMDFRNTTIAVAGATVNSMNMDTFFTQWAYKEGYPIYNINWNQVGTDVYLQLNQTTSMPSSVSLFYTPIEITLTSTTGDTTMRIFNNQATQLYHFTWPRNMISLAFDPNKWLLYQLAGIVHDDALDAEAVSKAAISIAPNPSATGWALSKVAPGSSLTLTDMYGHIVWANAHAAANEYIPGETLPLGMYILQVGNGKKQLSYKLIKDK